MRPRIEGTLEERAERMAEVHGYDTATGLMKDALRRHLEHLEAHATKIRR